MFALATGSPSRLLHRQVYAHSSHSSHHRAINLSLFTRRRYQNQAVQTEATVNEAKSQYNTDAQEEHYAGSIGHGDESVKLESISSKGNSPGQDVDASGPSETQQPGAIDPKNDASHNIRQNLPASRPQFQNSWRKGYKHLWPNKEAAHKTVTLDTAALGQPSTIRIVREQGRKAKNIPRVVKRPKFQEIGPEDIEHLALLPPEERPGPKEVDAAVNKIREDLVRLRQADGSYRREDCVAVAAKLMEGLTHGQLRNYLKRHEVTSTAKKGNDLTNYYETALLSRGPWFSGRSKFPKAALHRLEKKSRGIQHYAPRYFTAAQSTPNAALSPKAKVVELIIRELWAVSAQDEYAWGELDIRISSMPSFQVLMQNYDDVFQKRSRELGVRIQIAKDERIVRIEGPHGLVSDAFEFLLQDLAKVKCESQTPLPQDQRAVVVMDPGFVRQVELWTRTSIQVHGKGQVASNPEGIPIDVYYLGSQPADRDNAVRLMSLAWSSKDATHTHVQCDGALSKVVPLEAPIEAGNSVPFQGRHIEWRRWTYPARSGKTPGSEEPVSGKKGGAPREALNAQQQQQQQQREQLALNAAEHLFPAWQQPDEHAGTGPGSSYWQASATRQLQAYAGLLAHPANPSVEAQLAKARALSQRKVGSRTALIADALATVMEAPRTMLSGVPNLWTRLDKVLVSDLERHDELVVRLKPWRMPLSLAAPSIPHLDQLPELELTLRGNVPDGSTSLHSAQLVRSWRESDLLLPGQAADLRFVARSFVRSDAEMDPGILAFVATSELDVFGEGRLHIPSQMSLAVPRWACARWPVGDGHDGVEASSSSSPSTFAAAAASSGAVKVDYAVTTLEHRSSLRAQHGGLVVEYSTVEAGRAGGRRDELRFELDDAGATDGAAQGSAAAPQQPPQQRFLAWFEAVRGFHSQVVCSSSSS